MPKKEKVLILSMLSGFGHIRAGEALLDYAKENMPNVQAEHVDICNIDKSFKRYAKTYDFFVKKFPFLWEIVYKYLPVFVAKRIVFFGGIMSNKVKDYVKKENPDVIIFTNVTIIPIFIDDFRKMFPAAKIAVLVTDYHAHPYYVFKDLDYYFVGHSKIKEDFIKMGVANEKVISSGIPINPRFYIRQDIKELKSSYGIKNNMPVVLFIASFKISNKNLISIVKDLLSFDPKLNILFVANGKKDIYDLVSNKFKDHKRLSIVNWTNTMEEYIKISDVVISKAGGLTVTECLAIKKPMIMVNPIPGQEEHNAEFVQENGLGIKLKGTKDIVRVLPKFISLKADKKDLMPKENPCQEIFQVLLNSKNNVRSSQN